MVWQAETGLLRSAIPIFLHSIRLALQEICASKQILSDFKFFLSRDVQMTSVEVMARFFG